MGNPLSTKNVKIDPRDALDKDWTCEIQSNDDKRIWYKGTVIDAYDESVDIRYKQGIDGGYNIRRDVLRNSPQLRNIKKKEFKKRADSSIEMTGTRNRSGSEKQKPLHWRPKLFDQYNKTVDSRDTRAITACVGRIKCTRGKKKRYCTGTVFDYDEKTENVFVITSAFSLVDDEKWLRDTKTKVYFETMPDERGSEMNRYECTKYVAYGSCQFNHQQDSNDLLICVFQGDKKWNNANVNICLSDEINCNFHVYYTLFGYAKSGDDTVMTELTGKCNEDKENRHCYFRKSKDKQQFLFNGVEATDTHRGAAIVTEFGSNQYYICGVYTGHKRKGKADWDNRAVALNREQKEWIDYVKSDIHKYETQEDIMNHLQYPK